jgi:hypothetical protein
MRRGGIFISWIVLAVEGGDIHKLDSVGCGRPGYS